MKHAQLKNFGNDELDYDLRTEQMATMYKSGVTLQEIGNRFSVSRERVRQLLKPTGIDRYAGGGHVRGIEYQRKQQEKLQAAREYRAQVHYGVTAAEYREIRKMGTHLQKHSPLKRYFTKKRNVIRKYGAEAWQLSLNDWWKVWKESGKFEDCGRQADKYTCTRIDLTKPFKAGNVKIVPLQQATGSYWANVTPEQMAAYHRPRKRRKTKTRSLYLLTGRELIKTILKKITALF